MLSPWSSPQGQARPLPDAARPRTSRSAGWGGEAAFCAAGVGRASADICGWSWGTAQAAFLQFCFPFVFD